MSQRLDIIESFTAAWQHVERINARLSESQLLALYGFYKQALHGDIPFAKPTLSEGVDPKVVAKWQVWHDHSGMSKEEAAKKYIHLLMSYDPSWNPNMQSKGGELDGAKSGEGNASPKATAQAPYQRRRKEHATSMAALTEGLAPKARRGASGSNESNSSNVGKNNPRGSAAMSPSNTIVDKGGSNSKTNSNTGSQIPGSEKNSKNPVFVNVSSSTGNISDSLVEGKLFKQRDVFKGWRERYFRLEHTQVLNYYINNPVDDPTPRNSILMVECDIIPVELPASSPGSSYQSPSTKFFPFVISHPASSKTYKLAATDVATRDVWIHALRRAAKPDEQRSMSFSTTSNSNPDKIASNMNASGSSSAEIVEGNGMEVVHRKDAEEAQSQGGGRDWAPGSSGVPPNQWKKVALMLDRFMSMTAETGNNSTGKWVPFGGKLGVQGYKLASTEKFVTVKGEGVVNHSVSDVFRLLFDPVRKKAYDSQLDEGARLSVYNSQTVCDHLQMKAIWPTTARDFLNLVHWRVVSSDTAVIICFGIPGR